MKIFNCTSNRPLFLILGLWTQYEPGDEDEGVGHPTDRFEESEGARNVRRNNLALAGIVSATLLAGAGPQNLEVFGVTANGVRGVLTICNLVIVCHIYWYLMRWRHLVDDAKIQKFSTAGNPALVPLREELPTMLHQKSAARTSNLACFHVCRNFIVLGN